MFQRCFIPALSVLFLSLLTACAGSSAVRKYTVEVVAEYPHDTLSYTQGLFFHNGRLQESAGEYGHSSFRKDVDLETGRCARRLDFEAQYFAEGSTVLGGELFILTWLEHVAFVYDADSLIFKRAHRFPRQGWGLTTDGKQLIASDGSHQLHFLDTQFKRLRSIEVTLDGKMLPRLNELEWIDGRIWANIYQSDRIAIINPSDGKVEGLIDCKGLLPKQLRTKGTDVLNGIATDGGRIFLTGKNWPRLYEVKLVEKR
ncbi:MAG: glutaminyl-peptide cyclotransferase [Bacteroidales bacterium]|nr:glutaminyl-peptide cyclotransferase [Bacteroidales bacterium]